ncbi:MAG: hypothetical protein PVJ43_06715 [Gemmatimonadales bacterium]|jgi:hypothetical protein
MAKKKTSKKAKEATPKKIAKRAKQAVAKQAKKAMAKPLTCREKAGSNRHLYRVIFRGKHYLGSAEQFHAKVVATDFATAVERVCAAMELDPTKLEGVAVTLIREDTELADGKVFDFARRSRGFGERGGWHFKDILPQKQPTGPRKTEVY